MNPQGCYLMGIAAIRLRITKLPALAERTGIPYQTLHRRFYGNFGQTRADELKAIFRVLRMNGEEQAEFWQRG